MATSTDSEFASARDATDLVAGNQRAIAAISDALGVGAASAADAASILARTASTMPWSGPAADAFTAHRRSVIDRVGDWDGAMGAVRSAVEEYQNALAAAQNSAGDALDLWRRAQRLAATAYQWNTPQANLASNATAVRAELQATVASAARRARRKLDRARDDLDHAGDTAVAAIRSALDGLHHTPLPILSPTASVRDGSPGVVVASETAAWSAARDWSGATVTVEPHDSLWSIAQRDLGDPSRWHEIYQLNAGHLVAPHTVFTNPNDIHPGWTLRIPASPGISHALAAHPSPPAPGGVPGDAHDSTPAPVLVPPLPSHGPGSGPGPLSHPSVGAQSPGLGLTPVPQPLPRTAPPHNPASSVHARAEPAFDLGDGLILAGGVAVVVAGIAAAVGIQHRYTAGRTLATAGETPPQVRALSADLTTLRPVPGVDARASTAESDDDRTSWGVSVPVGHRDGRTVLLDAAGILGVGLTGPGASAAARALLISLLTDHRAGAWITPVARDQLLGARRRPAVVDADERGQQGPRSRSGLLDPGSRIVVPTSSEAALDTVEAELVTRTRLLDESAGRWVPAPRLLVVTSPDDGRRLHAVAELGGGLGIAVLVLGSWRPGITCTVDDAGQIVRVSGRQAPQWAEGLVGLGVFTANSGDAHTLIGLLGHVDPDLPPPRRPRATTHAPDQSARVAPIPEQARTEHSPVTQRPGGGVGTSPDTADGDAVAGEAVAPESSRISQRLSPDTVHPSQTPRRATESAEGVPAPVASGGDERAEDTAVDHPAAASSFPCTLSVLGRFTLDIALPQGSREISATLVPKFQEVLVYLALHPRGARRDQLNAAIWPGSVRNARPYNSFHSALSQIRKVVRQATDDAVTDLILHREGRYCLNPDLVTVDYWQVEPVLTARRGRVVPRAGVAGLREAIARYHGDLADNLPAAWLEAPREAIRKDVLALIETLVEVYGTDEPAEALDLLHQACRIDPYTEEHYRRAMHMQAHLNLAAAIPRTLALLTATLADIDQRPSAQTLHVAATLRQDISADRPQSE